MNPRKIELLSPAANAETAIEAILHGADAVYIGGPSHGARHNASNSIDDIRRVVDFAHTYRAKVYTTVNTIVYDSELRDVERLVTDLWKAGVDAIIVQDMGLLRLNLPPIALHASTQCDIRTPEKARFLEEAGFSQMVLARELTLGEIREIADSVTVPVETFVHGALCVSYSGRCHASLAALGRSANRGECAQICRQKWRISDSTGRRLAPDGHFLSLRDFNASDLLADMIEAGASSFKIEGRLKDVGYVKNITAYYRERLDRIIAVSGGRLTRSSVGESLIEFSPATEKSFNRGFTHYFLDSRRPSCISNPLTPKSLGERIDDINVLHNGDGIAYIDSQGEYTGMTVNKIEKGRIIGNKPLRLPRGSELRRTYDLQWQKMLSRPSAVRKIDFDLWIDRKGISAEDARGVRVRLPLEAEIDKAKKPMDFRRPFEKTGNTPFRLRNFHCSLNTDDFIPLSVLTELRRRVLEALESANRTTYPIELRRDENPSAVYPATSLTYADNVANRLAEQFYRDHGVERIEQAMETRKGPTKGKRGERVMTTRHCILRELGKCLRNKKGTSSIPSLPITLESGNLKFQLTFDCQKCEMGVVVI